ncbi:MAG: hypothetical protein LH471_10130, partial [Salinibacterium sp.]|nr:hypothetical protein [Salinibacterium sp.]
MAIGQQAVDRVPSLTAPAALVEVRTVREGSNGGHQHLHTAIGDRLQYQGHEASERGGVAHLKIRLHDTGSALDALVALSSKVGSASFTATTTVTNGSAEPTTLLTVSALMLELVTESKGDYADYRLHWARNDWTKECRWQHDSIVDLLVPDLGDFEYSIDSRRPFGVAGVGTWSSGHFLPMGMLENLASGFAVAWQIENPGPWRWEVGDRSRSLVIGTYGPLDLEHHWNRTL